MQRRSIADTVDFVVEWRQKPRQIRFLTATYWVGTIPGECYKKTTRQDKGRVLFYSLCEEVRDILVRAGSDGQQKTGPFSALAHTTAHNIVEFTPAVENLRTSRDNIQHVGRLDAVGVREERARNRQHLEDVPN
jgi:hypothetical protein